ncbi:allantoate amidohydrolase [Usitatibacter palustris]|uniref:N-carbamoyl-L-amino acid hydrolase n=1 Tax=Usitatibacter palustris TaxID=2732487 RepID=A0A6M4HBN3_9PROT|nr:allantoate amidohydrolase [Usitatibacter palustris]QJR15894.1 N-carbamoyl-L-amino acid hydrolase [Usitatibacter palustris]
MTFGERILERAECLAAFTEDEGRLTRTYLTPMHRKAGEQIAAWMREAGMQASFDALGNVVGRYEGATADAPVVLTGSHMDTVVDAGRYDGVFGILTAIECVADLAKRGKRLPFAFEVAAFGDEEGVRFGVTMIGSRAFAGRFRPEMLEARDKDGVSLREALTAFGGNPDEIPGLARKGIAAFVESHIEQGPVLLDDNLSVGVVTSIAGSYRVKAKVTGLAGHAGTVRMPGRRDALMAAAEMALAVEAHCAAQPHELVGTVGKLAVAGGGATNVIPGSVEFTVDLRSGDDAVRRRALRELEDKLFAVAKRRSVALEWNPFFELQAMPCDPRMQAALAASIDAQGIRVRHLPSGAGHDAMELAHVAPMAMLFVRCGNGGISHHPSETLAASDADIATSVLLHFLESYVP